MPVYGMDTDVGANRKKVFLDALTGQEKQNAASQEETLVGQNFFLGASRLSQPHIQTHYKQKIQNNYLSAYINNEYSKFHVRRSWITNTHNSTPEFLQRDRQIMGEYAQKYTSVMEIYKGLLEQDALKNTDLRIMRTANHDLERTALAMKLYITHSGIQPIAQRWLEGAQNSPQYSALKQYFLMGGRGVLTFEDEEARRLENSSSLQVSGAQSRAADQLPFYSPHPHPGEITIPADAAEWEAALYGYSSIIWRIKPIFLKRAGPHDAIAKREGRASCPQEGKSPHCP